MKNLYTPKASLILFISLILISCTSDKKEQTKQEIQRLEIGQLKVVANFESHELVQPYAVNIMDNGNVVAIDGNRKEVVVIKPNGELIAKFGQEGKGPGEFVMPLDIQFVENTINIIDVSQYKVLTFNSDGTFKDSYSYKTNSTNRKIALLGDKKYLSNADGLNNSLLEIVNLNTDSTFYFGEAKGRSIEVMDFQKEVKALSNGEIPSVFKNSTTMYYERDFIYAFLDSYSELRKYSLSGELIWEKKVDIPYMDEIFESTVKAVKSMQGRLIAITYMYDLNVLDENVYLLTKKVTDKPQLVFKLNSNGDTDSIFTLPESESYFTGFALDKERGQIYLTSTDGEIVKATFEF